MADITIEVHGNCTVIADRTPLPGKTHIHYEPLIVENRRYTPAQIADAFRFAQRRRVVR